MAEGEVWGEGDAFSCKCESLRRTFCGKCCGSGAKVVIVGLKVAGLAFCPLYLRLVQHRKNAANDAARYLILQVEYVTQIAVEAVRPNVPTVGRVNKLAGDADTFA